jgi:hypothetical protein
MDPSRKFTHSTNAVHAVSPAQFYKIHPNAQEPEYNDEEFYWDIFAHARDENRNDDVTGDSNVFCTGFAIVAPTGFTCVIEPHPDLYKYGYSMYHSHRVSSLADQDEEIKIVLRKDKDCDDLELPHAVGRMYLQLNATCALNVNRVAAKPISQPQKKRGAASSGVPQYEEYTPQITSLPTNARRSRQGGLA